MLADEPTGNLDQATGQEVMALLRALNADTAYMVVITHDTAIAAAVPRRIEFRDGRVVADAASGQARPRQDSAPEGSR